MPLTTTGYSAPSLQEIIEQMQATARSEYGTAVDVSSDSVLGHFIGVVALQVHQQYADLQALWDNSNPETASGKALDDLMYVSGVVRKGETASTTVLTLTGVNGTVVPVGTQVSHITDATILFETDVEVTIPVSGTIDVAATNINVGVVKAPADTLTGISLVGITSVTNAADAIVGTNVETDQEARERRDRSLSLGGNTTVMAIQASLEQLNGVTTAKVVENDTFDFVSRGVGNTPRPPKSFESIVEGGVEDDITKVIFYTKPAGIEAFGTTEGLYTDDSGIEHQIFFTRPTQVVFSTKVTYTLYDEETFPSTGEESIKENLIEFANSEYVLGREVLPQRMYGSIFAVPGIKSVVVEVSYGDTGLVYTTDQLNIEVFERATLDIADILLVKTV